VWEAVFQAFSEIAQPFERILSSLFGLQVEGGFLSQPADGGVAFGCSGMLLGVRPFPPKGGFFWALAQIKKAIIIIIIIIYYHFQRYPCPTK